ncbi:hypothetical protein Bbelb_400640 [Branchiostoma belcheri]|nr:hypothetical protein Bbelb_400640 [Branchiostoma belcheri]
MIMLADQVVKVSGEFLQIGGDWLQTAPSLMKWWSSTSMCLCEAIVTGETSNWRSPGATTMQNTRIRTMLTAHQPTGRSGEESPKHREFRDLEPLKDGGNPRFRVVENLTQVSSVVPAGRPPSFPPAQNRPKLTPNGENNSIRLLSNRVRTEPGVKYTHQRKQSNLQTTLGPIVSCTQHGGQSRSLMGYVYLPISKQSTQMTRRRTGPVLLKVIEELLKVSRESVGQKKIVPNACAVGRCELPSGVRWTCRKRGKAQQTTRFPGESCKYKRPMSGSGQGRDGYQKV